MSLAADEMHFDHRLVAGGFDLIGENGIEVSLIEHGATSPLSVCDHQFC
jgi:hypothetical protein